MTQPLTLNATTSRRAVLAGLGTLTAAIGAVGWPQAVLAGKARWPVGLQLYTVMTELERDIDALLGELARIGYREVETIGTFGRDPAALRALLDKHHLKSPSQHLMPMALYANFLAFTRKEITAADVGAAWANDMAIGRLQANVAEAIGWAKTLGQQFVVLQMIWPEQLKSVAMLEEMAKQLNAAGRLCADAGLTFCLHNHAAEFTPADGVVPYDWLLEHTDPALVKLELDIYWATRAGRDPAQLLKQHHGRYLQCHVKDSDANGGFATVGQGVIDMPRVLDAAWANGVRHFYVEYDRPDDPMKVVREAYTYLHKASSR